MPTVPGLPSAPPLPGGCWRLNSHLDSTGWSFLKIRVFNTDPMMEPPGWLPSLSSPGRWGRGAVPGEDGYRAPDGSVCWEHSTLGHLSF